MNLTAYGGINLITKIIFLNEDSSSLSSKQGYLTNQPILRNRKSILNDGDV